MLAGYRGGEYRSGASNSFDDDPNMTKEEAEKAALAARLARIKAAKADGDEEEEVRAATTAKLGFYKQTDNGYDAGGGNVVLTDRPDNAGEDDAPPVMDEVAMHEAMAALNANRKLTVSGTVVRSPAGLLIGMLSLTVIVAGITASIAAWLHYAQDPESSQRYTLGLHLGTFGMIVVGCGSLTCALVQMRWNVVALVALLGSLVVEGVGALRLLNNDPELAGIATLLRHAAMGQIAAVGAGIVIVFLLTCYVKISLRGQSEVNKNSFLNEAVTMQLEPTQFGEGVRVYHLHRAAAVMLQRAVRACCRGGGGRVCLFM